LPVYPLNFFVLIRALTNCDLILDNWVDYCEKVDFVVNNSIFYSCWLASSHSSKQFVIHRA